MDDLMLWIEMLNDLDYYAINIVKMLLKATETHKDEKLLLDQFYGNLIKLGLNSYVHKEIKDIVLDSSYRQKISIPSSATALSTLNKEQEKVAETKDQTSPKLVTLLTKNLENFNLKLKPYITEIISYLQTIEEGKDVDFSNFDMEKIKLKIRNLIREPQDYFILKRLDSFNKNMKSLWNLVETTLILCLLYHTNLIEIGVKWAENDKSLAEFDKYFDSEFKFFGKKMNDLIVFMYKRYSVMKGSFSNIVVYAENFVKMNNDFIINMKKIIIDKLKVREEERKKEKEAKEKELKENIDKKRGSKSIS
jgi:hypothetical protein